MLVLADTGILLRLLDRSASQHADVRQATRVIHQRGDRCAICPQNAAEFWNVCTRPATARAGLGLSATEADRRLRVIERIFIVLGERPATYGHWRKLVVSHAVMGVQAHDARLVALMIEHGLSHLLTLNPADFARYPNINVITPADLIHP